MTPTRIQIRLQHQAGQRLDALWAIVTPFAQQNAGGLAHDALTLPLPRPDHDQARPDLHWNGFGWELRNHTHDAQLFINNQSIAAGESHAVVVGDTLEIGLCRFLIEAAEPVFTDSDLSTALSESTSTCSTNTLHSLIENFSGEQTIDDGDPFQILPADATFDQAVESTHTDAITNISAPVEVISQLNEAYFIALRNPDADLKIHAKDHIHTISAPPNLGTDDATLTLEEIISSKLEIDAILERFNDYGVNPLTEPEIYDDVLWLFAPEDQTPNTERRLPPRSRQDHHIMSLDSSYVLANRSHAKGAPP